MRRNNKSSDKPDDNPLVALRLQISGRPLALAARRRDDEAYSQRTLLNVGQGPPTTFLFLHQTNHGDAVAVVYLQPNEDGAAFS